MSNEITVVPEVKVGWLNLDNLSTGLVTSIQHDTPEGRKKLYNLMSSEDLKADSVIGAELKITDIVCHPVKFANVDDGEITDAIRTVFVLDDGGTVGCVSDGIVRAIVRLAALGMVPPFNPPLACKITKRKSGASRSYYTLELL